ncbi:barstar family protein [Enterobacter sichuanensis]|uniref:Barstar family protein n=1 Tax=Enterobacter sichuanensis TaxID=2071710 RepID=A0ABS6GHK0_9ENTR|nr:barstar family protein [Enterobacter sichuanensis]MBU5926326.1 barstar family protein [Enterobacter sichuanensis]OZV01720.1 barnase inhibitor [Enterobacter cloacae]PAO14810.1 barnase inhibitor [Enterobacter cloacae]
MKVITLSIDFKEINDVTEFHNRVKQLFGFPDFYGNNFHAFIDCLTSLRFPEEGMTSLNLKKDEFLLLKISNINNLDEELKHDFLLSIQEVNNRSILFGEEPTILLLLCTQHK